VKVPVVGSADGQRIGHGGFPETVSRQSSGIVACAERSLPDKLPENPQTILCV